MAELGKDEKGGGAALSGANASAQPSAPAKKVYAQLQVPTAEQIVQEDFMNNCAVRTIMAGVLGSGLGLVFGLVMGSMDMAGPGLDGAGAAAEKQTTRQVIRQMATNMSQRSWTYAKGFGAMGAMFSGSECVIEKIRAKHDIYNSVGAGCFAGAALAHSGGPKAMCAGCVTFAAFSAFIDRIMDHD